MSFSSWTSAMENVSGRMAELLPAALGAAALLAAGWLVAIILRAVSRKLVAAVLVRVGSSSRLGHGLAATGLSDYGPRVVAAFVYWTALLFFAAAAMEKLSLPVVTALLQSIGFYLPKVLLAVLVAFIGLGAGSLANQWITSAAGAVGVEYAPALGRVAQIGIFIAALTIGAQQIGLASDLFTSILSITVGATLGGMALAFGLGSGPIVTNIMASYYAARAYEVGDVVRVAGIEGTVREINPTSIVLDAADGQVHLPARKYCDEVSVVLRSAR